MAADACLPTRYLPTNSVFIWAREQALALARTAQAVVADQQRTEHRNDV